MKYKVRMTEKKVVDSVVLAGVGILFLSGSIWVGSSLMINKWDPADTYVAKYKPVVVISESMEPTIKTNGMVFLEKEDYKDVVVGDIIMLDAKENGLVMHRVKEKQDGIIKTQGDNNMLVDPWEVTEDEYKGTVVKVNNNLAGILTYLFGDFTKLTVSRLLLGCSVLAGVLAAITISIINLYEHLTVPFFMRRALKKKGMSSMVRREYYKGLEERVTTAEIDADMDLFREVKGIKGWLYRYRMVKLNSALEEEEKAIRKTRKRQQKIQQLIEELEAREG